MQIAVITAVGKFPGINVRTLGRADPSVARKYDRDGFRWNQRSLTERLRDLPEDQRRAAIIPKVLGVSQQFLANDFLEPVARLQHLLKFRLLPGEFLLLAVDFHLFEFGQMPQFQFENRLRLDIGQLETLHQDLFRFLFLADDLDHGIDIEISDQESVENMQTLKHPVEPELKTPLHGSDPEIQPLLKRTFQIKYFGPAIKADHVHVDPVTLLQRCCGKEVIHERCFIHPVGPGFDHDPGGIFVI